MCQLMLENREKIEQFLWWEQKGDTSNIWYDNWTNLVPLFMHHSTLQICYGMGDIKEFLTQEGWDYDVMQDKLPDYVVEHVQNNLATAQFVDIKDKPWWTKSSKVASVLKVLGIY